MNLENINSYNYDVLLKEHDYFRYNLNLLERLEEIITELKESNKKAGNVWAGTGNDEALQIIKSAKNATKTVLYNIEKQIKEYE